MQGSGSKIDPFRPETWEDFLSICGLSVNYYIKWADNPVTVDFNDIAPNGVTEPIQLEGQIDFNGLTIKNVHAKNTMPNASNFVVFPVTQGSTICNVNFDSIYLDSIYGLMSVAHADGDNTYLHDVSVSGEVYDTQSIFKDASARSAMGGSYFDRISAKIRIQNKSSFYFIRHIYGKNYISNSTLEFHGKATSFYVGSNDAYSTAFTGNNWYLGNLKVSSFYANQGKHDYFDITVDGNVYASQRTDSGGISVYNSDKMSLSSAVTGMAGCTTQQLHNAQYLHDLGFPIGV